ncbi:carotenoid oxygenase family protein [Aspergillus neoniger CBS 115656]|uniref:9-cis-epoxycarotenoid dioxygenase n=1 Tax=Aspergillus neoniger (strain CBS 115656) TaxID=1448310 RepID=A0A318YPC0_ASPNB|nr:9-cis-epoxycarotenoid dioxygenase [Aspergillus neoniger CBS 115656]PYH30038.1 9-cis-epoxycarotenoid dioxygenase [Aspergillus neoniger CBS 115656]
MAGRQKNLYLLGNFAPIQTTVSDITCNVKGSIPEELYGGQYVRNGSNPLKDDTKHDIHWLDGDGMLTGVFFKRDPDTPGAQPVFSNQYIVTDVYGARKKSTWIYPVIPGMNTMIDPRSSSIKVAMSVVRTAAIVTASIWGWIARPIIRIGTANTSLFHHDGRVLATNEIGPPMRVFLPSLKTVGWFTGSQAEGESDQEDPSMPYFGAPGLEGVYKEMTTAHPRVDRETGELILFHSTFLPPYINYSIVPQGVPTNATPALNQAVPGLKSGKLMHDFGVSHRHTVLIDTPVSLDPYRLRHGRPAVEYDPAGHTRLGVFPRHSPDRQWALSVIPFEFPHVPEHLQMSATKYVYGCSMREGNFATRHNSCYKIDSLVKVNVESILRKGLDNPPSQVHGCVDTRSIHEIIYSQDPHDPIQVFALPPRHYAQECSFVPRKDGVSEDDGWLVTYVFDEAWLDDSGVPLPDAHSELWIIDAVSMKEVVGRVILPQRVPYGMHGNWFSEEEILNQRGVHHYRNE